MSGQTELSTPVADATPRPWRISPFEVNAGGVNRMIMGADNFAVAYVNGRTAEENAADAALIIEAVNAFTGAALETQDGQLRELNTELLKANLLNSVLYEALKPFAASFEALVSNTRIAWGRRDWNEHMPGHWTIDIAVTMNDGRRAREALSQAERGRGADVAVERSTPVSLRATPNGEPA